MALLSSTYSATTDFERRFVRPKLGRTLILGSHVYPGREDRRPLFARAEGWDLVPGDGVDRVVDLECALPAGTAQEFDHIECISVLEHSRRPWLIAQNIERLLRVNGTLHLTAPFIWREHAYPQDYWRFTIEGIKSLFIEIAWRALRYAHIKLTEQGEKTAGTKVREYPYFARTEVCAFGVLA